MTTDVLYRDVRERLFAPAVRRRGTGPLVGLELEVIPVDDAGRRVPVEGPGRSVMAFLRPLARMERWREGRSGKGTPLFEMADGARLTFEPGGQLEVSAAPQPSASGALRRLEAIIATLERAAAGHEVTLLATGIDPVNTRDDVPLQFECDRYRRMGAYFDAIGPAGVRMMRQTATLHVNLDLGPEPVERWRLLQALAPVLVAMFANSPRYRGEPSGYLSYRAETWRTVDWSRTGLVDRGGDPVREYLDFALSARAMLVDPVDGEYPGFGDLWQRGGHDLGTWRDHLTTLFPEVRPRGYYEVRSIDALPLRWVSAPVVLLAGLTHDPLGRRQAWEVLGQGRTALLHVAGARGLEDRRLAGQAGDLVDIALAGCRRLGADFIEPADVEAAEDFFHRYTRRRRSPAHDDASSARPSRLAGASR